MSKRDEFIKSQKIVRFATVGKNKIPHIVPVWYKYSRGKFQIGTNTKTQKARNVERNNFVSLCIDKGTNAPDIFGVMIQGTATLITDRTKVERIAKRILLRYFNTMENKSAKELLEDTDCIIEVQSDRITSWSY